MVRHSLGQLSSIFMDAQMTAQRFVKQYSDTAICSNSLLFRNQLIFEKYVQLYSQQTTKQALLEKVFHLHVNIEFICDLICKLMIHMQIPH